MKRGYKGDFEIDDPIGKMDLLDRIAYARDHNRIAVFVKQNGDVWAIFSDTILGKKYIKTPRIGSKFVGCFCNGDYRYVFDRINLKHKEFENG